MLLETSIFSIPTAVISVVNPTGFFISQSIKISQLLPPARIEQLGLRGVNFPDIKFTATLLFEVINNVQVLPETLSHPDPQPMKELPPVGVAVRTTVVL